MNKFSCELSAEDKRSIEEAVGSVRFDDKWLYEKNPLLGKDITITTGTIKNVEVRFESELRFGGGDVSG